jgi:hypothetical protein
MGIMKKILMEERELEDRIEVLEAEVAVLLDGMETAWGIIANAHGGDWSKGSPHWVEVAKRWRDDHWHQALARNEQTHILDHLLNEHLNE